MDLLVFPSRSGVRLELSLVESSCRDDPGRLSVWRARLVGPGVDASVVASEAGWEPQALADFLARLATDWHGWEGERGWTSEDGELRLTATHPSRNTVIVQVELQDEPLWACRAELELDPGVFEQLAADARRLGGSPVTQYPAGPSSA